VPAEIELAELVVEIFVPVVEHFVPAVQIAVQTGLVVPLYFAVEQLLLSLLFQFDRFD